VSGATHPHISARSAAKLGESGLMLITAEIAKPPFDFSTRNASRNTCALSGTRLMTQLKRMMSAVPSAIGRCSS
jgi:hypothetical protein